jgi:putative ABC transport system substrate-binding protein
MKRREFVTLIGGAAAWPIAAWAQQATGRLRLGTVSVNPRSSPFYMAFEQRLAELGYKEGQELYFRVRANLKH